MFLHKYLSLEFREITSKTDRVEELQLKMGQLLIGYPTVDLRENFEKFCSGLPLEKSSEFLHEMQVRPTLSEELHDLTNDTEDKCAGRDILAVYYTSPRLRITI